MITLDNLTDRISESIKEYTDDIKIELETKLDETADKILAYIKDNITRSGRKNATGDNFIKEDIGSGYNKTIMIYASKKGKLVHLIEFGFQHRSGKYIMAKPFLRPAFDTFTPRMLEDIKGIISGK